MKITEEEKPVEQQVNIFEILADFQEKYRNVEACEIKGNYYVYRALGRKEYRELLNQKGINVFDKEEVLCESCLLYPDGDSINWDTLPAGIPNELSKRIIKFSYLDSIEHRRNLMDYYRAEMYDLDNQITCIINEAFPDHDIEEIEAWDIEKTTKYLSRAEWKLTNFKGLQFKDPEGDFYETTIQDKAEKTVKQDTHSKQKKDTEKTIRGGNKRDKLTPEKLEKRAAVKNNKIGQKAGTMSIEELRRKFPEVNWGVDMGKMGLEGIAAGSTLDTTPPALRTPGQSKNNTPPTGW